MRDPKSPGCGWASRGMRARPRHLRIPSSSPSLWGPALPASLLCSRGATWPPAHRERGMGFLPAQALQRVGECPRPGEREGGLGLTFVQGQVRGPTEVSDVPGITQQRSFTCKPGWEPLLHVQKGFQTARFRAVCGQHLTNS